MPVRPARAQGEPKAATAHTGNRSIRSPNSAFAVVVSWILDVISWIHSDGSGIILLRFVNPFLDAGPAGILAGNVKNSGYCASSLYVRDSCQGPEQLFS